MAIGAQPSRPNRRWLRQSANRLVLTLILFEAASLPVAGAVRGKAEGATGVISTGAPLSRPQNSAGTHRPLAVHREVDEAIEWYAKRHHLPPALLHAVIKTESDFKTARSRAGALGLMQLMPATAASLRVTDPFNPVDNIGGGARYLRYLLTRFHGNLGLALAAYNAGEYRVKRYGTIPPIQETRRYVQKVMPYYRAFRTAGRLTATMASTLQSLPVRPRLPEP